MIISNLEITQASIEMFCCIICIVMAVSIRMNNHNNRSMLLFVHLFSFAALTFFAESCAYIFRGNLDVFSVAMTRVSNLAVFCANLLLSNFLVRYISSLCNDKNPDNGKSYIRIANALALAGFAIVIINLFCGWMYYFDDANYYHRNNMWYVYTMITMGTLLVGALLIIKKRKYMSRIRMLSILLCTVIPIIAVFIQIFYYGLAITNISIGIAIISQLVVYMYDWIHSDVDDIEKKRTKRKWFDIIILFVIMVISMGASIFSCVMSIQRISEENSVNASNTVAEMVSAGVENEFIKPITVSETIGKDYSVRSFLNQSAIAGPESVEEEFSAYLESIKKGFGYQMVFAVSDKTKAFYSYNGITKYIDVVNDSHDIWYKDFLEKGVHYDLNVDTDEANNWNLSVFVNTEVLNHNGDLIGVCGVGVEMQDLIADFKKYEEQYNIKIELVDRDGLIQVDSDGSRIETCYVDNSYFDKLSRNEWYYERKGDLSYLTRYLDELDWYLVVVDYNPQKIDVAKVVIPSIIIFSAGIIIMGIIFAIISIGEHKTLSAFKESYKASITDGLTGLYNRRRYEEDCALISSNGIISEYIIIVLDINSLKYVNDNMGHLAGDELIIAAANCMNNAFSSIGCAYRIGGDEFVVLLKCGKSKLNDAIATFEHLTNNWHGKYDAKLSISKGVVVCSDYPNDTLEELAEKADKLMYEEKALYHKING